jgi:hypothetical protein
VTDGKIKLKATKLPDQITAICCIVCSRVSERPLIAAEGEAEGEGIVICPHCLAEGDIDAKLERHAARLESRSRWLRALIGRLEVPSPAVLKEFAGPVDTEQAVFWDSPNDLLDDTDLPPSRAAHPLASRLQEYPGARPLIKSGVEVHPEPGKALTAALVNRREYGYGVTLASGTLCPHCSRPLRVTAVRHIDESGFDIICESCHADIIRAKRR